MKVPWMWLGDYVKLPWGPKEAAQHLTMAGINVENLSYETLDVSSVVSGKILEVTPHPEKSDLMVGILDAGSEKLQIVSGAPGFRKGKITLVARPGARLPGGVRIEEREFHGVLSQGMVLSANELLTGLPPRPFEDIVLLPEDTLPGIFAKRLFQLDDWVMELELTVNYSHCLGILGVALEASALAKTPLRLPGVLDEWNWAGPYGSIDPGNGRREDAGIKLRLPRPDLCPRYVGKVVKGVSFAYSPVELERRLYLAGQRPLNLIVDVTNYVMMETGQPLHAFDADKLLGDVITVRPAEPGEALVTIDEERRDLPENSIVIADASGPIAVAGIMGGKATEITETTRKVLIESACFASLPVRLASQHLRLRTEAALRFEKGVDPSAQAAVAERAGDLMAALSGGKCVPGYAETNHLKPEQRKINLRMSAVERVLGTAFSPETCRGLLEGINLKVETDKDNIPLGDGDSICVVVPPRRVDIRVEVDLIEEIARHYGYGRLGTGDLSRAIPGGITDLKILCRNKIGSMLVSLGGMESVTNSLLAPEDLFRLGWHSDDPRGNPVRLKNPLSSQESVLRTSLLPGLTKVALSNQRSKIPGIFIWEAGRVFFKSTSELPLEAEQIALLSYGALARETWLSGPEESDFYQMKGIVSALLGLLGIKDVKYLPGAGMPFHPGRSAKIVANMSVIGEIGQIHPVCQRDLEMALPATMAWLSLDGLLSMIKVGKYEPISKLMPVERDLAVVVSEEVPGGDVINAVWETGTYLVSVSLFDIWRKPPVPPGHKSLAIRLVYQPQDKTLTEQDLAADRQKIMDRLSRDFGAVLRI
ncbi:MAG TPA: phenylalanine--tRNA ligase subunit beta [Firmicutes bacterium]|jgi:phenylalanyl-tRNA synthetase beta chain|nr:phenylalanine--tRNA ligase subunit beta [Bacillota bacterium]